MILNISNNTDIIRYYPEWMIKRFENGIFGIETAKQNTVYELSPKNFELLVFQTKDPTNIVPYYKTLSEQGYNMLFIVTLTPYGNDIEPDLNKKEVYNSIKSLSKMCGKERIIWKYAPVIFNNEFNLEYHIKKFKAMSRKLFPYVSGCICEFLEYYEPPIHLSLYTIEMSTEEKKTLLHSFYVTAKEYNITLYSKHLKHNLNCMLREKIKELCNIEAAEEIPVLDMGLKNTCKGMCEYCNCGGNKYFTDRNCIPDSPIMIGNVDTTKRFVKKKAKLIL